MGQRFRHHDATSTSPATFRPIPSTSPTGDKLAKTRDQMAKATGPEKLRLWNLLNAEFWKSRL